MSAKKKNPRTCLICGINVSPASGGKYIFPVPAKYNYHAIAGAYACVEHAPVVKAEQRAEGQLEKVHRSISAISA